MGDAVRYITGRGGSLESGLSLWLASRFSSFNGRAVNDAFLAQSVEDQIQALRSFWVEAPDTPLITNSYGGYLLLLSLIDAQTSPKRVLMLSPLLGRSIDLNVGLSVRPPRERLLKAAIAEGRLCKPEYLEIVTGEDDPVCSADQARSVAASLPADQLSVLPGETHTLSHLKVTAVIEGFAGNVGVSIH